jgi:hypothetical protein
MDVMLLAEPVRRSFRRFVRLDCQVIRESDFKLVADLALDLSTKGMLVRSKARVLTGEEVVVSFKPPRCNQYFDAMGIVARVLHGRRPGDIAPSLGIEFIGVSREDERFLFEHLRGMAAPDPLRPPRSLALPKRPFVEPFAIFAA